MGNRRNRVRLVALAVITAGFAPACSASPQQAAESAAPTAPTTAVRQKPDVLQKQLGEKAGVGCPPGSATGPTSDCDVEVAVTNITQDAQCAPRIGKPPLEPDEQLVRIDLEYRAAPQFIHPDSSPGSLLLQYWGIGTAEGVDNDLRPYFSKDCLDQVKPLLPGTYGKKSVVVIGPRNATTLRLFQGSKGDGWEWDIPPAPTG
jgi:hypothetical protein